MVAKCSLFFFADHLENDHEELEQLDNGKRVRTKTGVVCYGLVLVGGQHILAPYNAHDDALDKSSNSDNVRNVVEQKSTAFRRVVLLLDSLDNSIGETFLRSITSDGFAWSPGTPIFPTRGRPEMQVQDYRWCWWQEPSIE